MWYLPFRLLKRVSHFNLPLEGCRSTGGGGGGRRSYTVACRATVGHLVLLTIQALEAQQRYFLISRDTFSDSITERFRACFAGA